MTVGKGVSKVGDLAIVRQSCVVGQANIKKARIFGRGKRVQIIGGGTHIQHRALFNIHLASSFGLDPHLVVEHLFVLTRTEVIVLVLVVELVVAVVFQLAEDQAEEHRHVRVVMQGHSGSLFYEEENKAIIFARSVDYHSI